MSTLFQALPTQEPDEPIIYKRKKKNTVLQLLVMMKKFLEQQGPEENVQKILG